MNIKTLLAVGLLALGVAGCATVELTSPDAIGNGDRLLVIQCDGYEILDLIPLWSGCLEWDARMRMPVEGPALFGRHSNTQHLLQLARKIAERENCELVNVTFIDNYIGLNPHNIYGLITNRDTAISAVLRPRKSTSL